MLFIPEESMRQRWTENTVLSAEQGVSRLIEGNKRFATGEAHFPTVCKETLAALAREQHPYATILGCADSRVPPELIFDANFGELFIVRVAGNVISSEVMGSIQYAGSHLHTPLFVVLGHEGCGAVKSAIESKLNGAKHHSPHTDPGERYCSWLVRIRSSPSSEDQLAWAVEANVRWSMNQLMETPEGKQAAGKGRKKHRPEGQFQKAGGLHHDISQA